MEYKNKNDPKGNIVGALELCAPEVIGGLKYDYNSDYYRLGGMIYFSIFKHYPNNIKSRRNVSDFKINYKKENNFSFDCIDFINKLLISDYQKRIGFNNVDELRNHTFFKDFNWNELVEGKMKSPFPKIQRRSLGLCNAIYNFPKRIFLNNVHLRDDRIRNIFFMYDNINNEVVEEIYKSFIYNRL